MVMIGVGLAEAAGLIGALIRKLVGVSSAATLTFIIVLLGMISSVASDAGYLVLIPLGAAAFKSVGRNPLAGIAAAFAGVAAGFGVNFLITPLDGVLTEITNDAIALADRTARSTSPRTSTSASCSTIFVTIVLTFVTSGSSSAASACTTRRGRARTRSTRRRQPTCRPRREAQGPALRALADARRASSSSRC